MTLIDLPALEGRILLAGQLLITAGVVSAFVFVLVLLWMARHD